jgi:hypothetical protein
MLLFSTISTAEPIGWSNDIPLTSNDNDDSRDPSIAINGNLIHVVWEDQRHYASNSPEIYYINSTDEGKTWNQEKRLTFWESTKNQPKIAVNNSWLHVVWIDHRLSTTNRIWYMNSSDYGNTWSEPILISSPGDCWDVDMAINGSNIHVIYSDESEDAGGDEQLFYVNSTDNGLTWSSTRRLISTLRLTFNLAIDVYGDNVHIVWEDWYDKNGNPQGKDIFYINSTDNGITWSEEQNLTPLNNAPQSVAPYIAVYQSHVHVLFGDDRTGTIQLYYKRSEDNGITWSNDTLLTNNPEGKSRPEIDVYRHNVSIIWSDLRDGNWEIYYRNSSDNGYNWNSNIRITYDDNTSGSPDLEINKNEVDVVWMNKRDTKFEIYYKHYPIPFPPTNLTVDILGPNLILNWTPPHNSPSPVDHYLIYRSNTLDGFDFSWPWIDTSFNLDPIDGMIIPLRTSWNHTGAADPGDLNYSEQWYYCIRAIDANGWNDTNRNIVGKFVIPLSKGWNLISLPLAQRDTRISEVLKSIDGQYNIVQWFNAKDGIWHSSPSSLTNINRTMGLWIHMKNACYLSVVGAVPETTNIALYEGWNLVGYPSLKARNLGDALSGISWQAVQHYDAFDVNDPWKHNSTKKPDNLNDLKEMRPGGGFWVYVTINETWVRTRTVEDNKMVLWRVGESEQKVLYDQSIYESTIESPTKIEEDDYQIDNVEDDKLITKDQENNLAISLIPLIILIAFVLAEIGFLHKRKK